MTSADESDEILLSHIRNECVKILDSLETITRDEFKSNQLYQDAIIRRLEIIGEAAGNLSDGYCMKHPEIPIREMKAMRNILAHQYFRVDLDYIWKTASIDIPELIEMISE